MAEIKFIFPALLMLLNGSLSAQKLTSFLIGPDKTDLIEVFSKTLHINPKSKPTDGKRVAFSIVPTATTSGGKRILVSSINAAFLIGNDSRTNVSTVYFLPYTDFSENFGFGLKYNLFTPGNEWNIPGEFRISGLTVYSYGLGSSTTINDQFRLTYNNLRFLASANRKLYGNIFGGLGMEFDRNFSLGVSEVQQPPGDFEKYGIGTQSAFSSTGINLNLLHDNRKNSINPTDGIFLSAVLRLNPSWLSNENLWSSIYLDWRQYFPLQGGLRKLFAVSAFYWGSFGRVPYFNLPGTQLEPSGRSGRGYPRARFVGKHMLYAEGEFRFDLSANGLFGGVFFANFQALTNDVNKFTAINPATGFGARLKFNKNSDTNLTMDFGFGEDSFIFYIGLGEWF
jgi:outer membrane protein assembly factor BamA